MAQAVQVCSFKIYKYASKDGVNGSYSLFDK